MITISDQEQVTVSLKVVSRKRRRKCTPKSYDRFTNRGFTTVLIWFLSRPRLQYQHILLTWDT
jgi:hypothetical protein